MKRAQAAFPLISTWVLLSGTASHAAVAASHPTPAMIVAQALSAPDGKLDFARAKLTFDRIIDPSINTARTSADLDRLEHTAEAMAGPGADNPTKLKALRKVIYESGPWNGDRPFGYDHADPFGKDIRNKLLSTYLTTRRGNCVSMPALYLILADRMGPNVALAMAPLHEFVRYTDAAGHTMNLETTSGAYPARDSWIRQQAPNVRPRSGERPLHAHTDPRAERGADGRTVVEYLLGVERNADAIAVAGVILKYDPRNGVAMIEQAAGYSGIIATEFKSKYSHADRIPADLLPRYLALNAQEDEAYAAATSLGWEQVE
ncbi:MAG TPA: transglutaminase family protein [Caulobacteraceae bacterium]|nr:transglutaminase family protein [Caulobacteraceae bacterium]